MNAIGTHLCYQIDSGLTRWRLTVLWTPSRKGRGIQSVCTIFSLSVENEHAGTVRDGRTCTVTSNSQARTKVIFPVQLTTSRIGNHTRLMRTRLLHRSTIITTTKKKSIYPRIVEAKHVANPGWTHRSTHLPHLNNCCTTVA